MLWRRCRRCVVVVVRWNLAERCRGSVHRKQLLDPAEVKRGGEALTLVLPVDDEFDGKVLRSGRDTYTVERVAEESYHR